MQYHTYEISITTDDGLEFLSVVACDLQAALSDVRECYTSDTLDIVCATLKD